MQSAEQLCEILPDWLIFDYHRCKYTGLFSPLS